MSETITERLNRIIAKNNGSARERLNVGFSAILALVALAHCTNRHSFAVDRGIHKDLFLRAVPIADHKPAARASRRGNGVFAGDQIELIAFLNVSNVPVR